VPGFSRQDSCVIDASLKACDLARGKGNLTAQVRFVDAHLSVPATCMRLNQPAVFYCLSYGGEVTACRATLTARRKEEPSSGER
jgi:hypothetical protein